MSKVYNKKTKKKRIRISAEYMEGKLHFKTGEGWKACYDSESNIYTAEAYLAGYYDLYEINEEIYDKLKIKGMERREAHELIITGRHEITTMTELVDWFGKDFKILEKDDGAMIVRLTCNERAMRFWALQYGPYVEVLEPESLRNQLKEDISGMYERYMRQ